MSEAFMGEVRMFGFAYAPLNWAQCAGQVMPIQQNAPLYSILGTSFGGNGTTTFGLPNFASNVIVGAGAAVTGTNYAAGETGGEMNVLLVDADVPAHTHSFEGGSFRNNATTNVPGPTDIFGSATGCTPFIPVATTPAPTMVPMSPQSLSSFGSAKPVPHNNLMPTITMNFCICLNGIFPPR